MHTATPAAVMGGHPTSSHRLGPIRRAGAWLDSHGLKDGYAAIFTAPTRSPYQW